MAKLDTIQIRNKKTGKIKIINATSWGDNIWQSVNSDWERIGGEKRGDATLEQHKMDQREQQINTYRLNDPAEQKVRKDQENAFKARSGAVIETEGATEEQPSDENETNDGEEAPEENAETEPALEDWRSMSWRDLKLYVPKVTGLEPKRKSEALSIMKQHEESLANK